MYQFDFERKPSFVSINCKIRDAIKSGHSFIQISWGENQITIEKTKYGWDGRGWINKSSGYDIAQKFNRNGN